MKIGIVAHTERTPQAEKLRFAVHADFLSYDDGTLGCDAHHKEVLQRLAGMPSRWSVVLEDDAEPIINMEYQLRYALALAPSPIVSLYLGKQRPPQFQPAILDAIERADAAGANYIVSTRLMHAVGYAIRSDILPSLLKHFSTRPIDEHITGWAKLHGHLISYTWPSLVDHADTPTLFTHPDRQPRRPGRKAHRVGRPEHWGIQSVTMRS